MRGLLNYKIYHINPPIRPGLMHEGCVGEGQSTRVLNTNMVLLVKYSLIEESTRRYRYVIFISSAMPVPRYIMLVHTYASHSEPRNFNWSLIHEVWSYL